MIKIQVGKFYFNEKSSDEFDLRVIKKDGQFNQNTLIGSGDIKEKEVGFDYNPLFYSIDRKPFDIPLRLALMSPGGVIKEWNPVTRQKIVAWLSKKEYLPLYFEEDPERIYYVLATTNESSTALKKGYIDVNFRTNSPYAYRPKKEVVIDASTTTKTETIIGDEFMSEITYPIIDIKRLGTSNGILNIYKEGKESDYIRFEDLGSISNIRLFTKQGIIKDMDSGKFLYHHKNKLSGDKWIDLVAGENTITLSKGWKATFKYQEAIY